MKYLFFLCFLILSLHVNAQVFAQWRGPERDGTYPENNLREEWPANGPSMLWSADGIGTGFSSPVSDGNNIFVTGLMKKMDVLSCLTMNGKIIWQTPFGDAWDGSFPETRTTPTIEGGRAYVISGSGTIACMEITSGKILWSLDGIKTFEGVHGTWGVCESPLIYDDRIIYTPAGDKTTMVALDKYTGKTIWMSETLHDTSAYVSPRLINYKGKEIIVTLAERWFFGVDVSTGKIQWKYDYASFRPEKSLKIWPGAPRTNTITPLYNEGMIYITAGYNHPGLMFKISDLGDAITPVWIDSTLDCHHGGVVKVGNYIYGSNWIDNNKGNWCCIDWNSGKTMYEHKWFTKGSIITAGGMLYCFDEKEGNLGMVKPDPEKFELVKSFRVNLGKGPFWAHPTIQNGLLFIRHGDVVMAFDISRK